MMRAAAGLMSKRMSISEKPRDTVKMNERADTKNYECGASASKGHRKDERDGECSGKIDVERMSISEKPRDAVQMNERAGMMSAAATLR